MYIRTLQVVLHGESGCGKSGLISVCSDVMSSMGHNIHLKHINCNAMRPGELLGYFCDTDQYVHYIIRIYIAYSMLYTHILIHTHTYTHAHIRTRSVYIYVYIYTYNGISVLP